MQKELSSEQLEQLAADADSAFNSQNYEEAGELYRELLKYHPDSVTGLYALGTLSLQSNDLATAIHCLGRASELEPEAVDIAINLASAFYTNGNRVEALRQLQRASQFCKADPIFCAAIAEMSIRLGEPEAAIRLMSRLDRLTPDHQIILANAQGMLGNWQQGVDMLKQLHESIPDSPVVLEKLAVAAGQLRDFDLAIASYEKFLRLATPSGRDYLKFADLLLIAQETKRCDQALALALENGEDNAEVHVLRARTARLRGDHLELQQALDKALAHQANHAQAWSIKAEFARDDELGEFTQRLNSELEKVEEVAKLTPHMQALLNYALADLHDKASNYEQAAAALTQANHLQNVALAVNNLGYNTEFTEQQFDGLIEYYSKSAIDKRSASLDSEKQQPTPIFILGMARSGTTLVEKILGQNPHVYSAGEHEGMEFVASHYNHQLKHGRVSKPEDLTTAQLNELRQMYFDKLPKISQANFTDKLPHNFRHVGLILKLFPEARIIQMHRSFKDVAISIFSHPFSMGHNYATQWDELTHFYQQSERLMAHWSSLESPRLLDVCYEDLVKAPQQYAQELVEFCGFDWNESYMDFHKSVSQSYTFSEVQVRQPINTSRVERWKHYADYFPALRN